jgi:hypothetical protein
VIEFTGKDLQFHPAANIFRMLGEEDFESLVEDIRKNGLREPIKLLDGKVIDGRNRYRACLMAGVEVTFKTITTDDPAAYVMSLNHHRRHDSLGEMALCAARAKEYYECEAKERQRLSEGAGNKGMVNLPYLSKGPARDKAGEAFNVSGKTVDHGTTVITKGVPELVDAVESKKVSVSKAASIAQEAPEKQKEILEDPQKLKEFKKPVTANHVAGDAGCGDSVDYKSTSAKQYAGMAILQLKRIQSDQPCWKDAFLEVENWIKKTREKYGS